MSGLLDSFMQWAQDSQVEPEEFEELVMLAACSTASMKMSKAPGEVDTLSVKLGGDDHTMVVTFVKINGKVAAEGDDEKSNSENSKVTAEGETLKNNSENAIPK